jgi:hypothetical protein
LLFEGPRAKQMEQDIYSLKQSNSSFKEGETCDRFDTSNLHNNDKFVEAINLMTSSFKFNSLRVLWNKPKLP